MIELGRDGRGSSGSPLAAWGAAAALAAAILIFWVNGAVGMIGDEDNPHNLLFGGVILLAVAGAVGAGLRADGMARAMALAAAAHLAAAAAGLPADPLGGTLSMVMAGFWLLSALLFRKAAKRHSGR